MAIAIERTRATVREEDRKDRAGHETATSTTPKARTLTPDSETDPTEARIQRAQEKQPRKADEPCRFGCGRKTIDCHYYGPPCEERMRIHRTYFGESCAVLDEERRLDADAQERMEHGER